MARLDGKVAFVTGAARGQGRSHAVRLAEEGADIIAVDIASQIDTVPYAMAAADDLVQTVDEVEALGRRIVAAEVDVRDYDALKAALDDGVARLGRLDVVAANAGIVTFGTAEELSEETWRDTIDVDLSGVWHTVKAAIPHLRAAGGGAIVITSSAAGLKGTPNTAAYTAAKHGVVGLMRTLANELAPDMVRVNTLHPGSVDTDMIQNQALYRLLQADRHGDMTPRRRRTRLPGDERASHPVAGVRGHLQRRSVPRLGRSAVHHRRHSPGGRRRPGQVSRCLRINSSSAWTHPFP